MQTIKIYEVSSSAVAGAEVTQSWPHAYSVTRRSACVSVHSLWGMSRSPILLALFLQVGCNVFQGGPPVELNKLIRRYNLRYNLDIVCCRL